MRALLADAAQLHCISDTRMEERGSRAYLSTVVPPSDGQLHRCTIRARERARPQMRLVPMHTPTLVIGCRDRYWQGKGMRQIRTILSSTWRVRVRCRVAGSGACALPLTVVAVWLHRRAASASASARLHRRVIAIVILRANAHGSLVVGLTFCWCSISMSDEGGKYMQLLPVQAKTPYQIVFAVCRWRQATPTSHQGRHFRSQTAGILRRARRTLSRHSPQP